MKPLLLALAGLLMLTSTATAQAVDAAGQWDLTVPTNQGPITVVMVLKKDGEKLIGTLKALQGEGTGEGTQNGPAIALTFNATTPQGASVIVMKGTQDGDSMKGTLVRDGRAPVEWTAKRAAAKPADASDAIDVTGTWAFEVQTDVATGTPTMTFKQHGEKLSGNYSGLLGEAPLAGTLIGKNITFTINASFQGTPVTVVYAGTVDGGTMKGTVKLAEAGEGTFTVGERSVKVSRGAMVYVPPGAEQSLMNTGSHAIEFLGAQNHSVVEREMQNARCFVQHSVVAPSGDCEGTPVSILEAGATGLPVVSTRHAGIPDVVIEGQTGFLVDEGDQSGMSHWMSQFAEQPELARTMGSAARDHITRNFSKQHRISSLWKIIESCIAERPRARF